MEALFFPLVKEGKMDEFKAKWQNFLVLSNEIEDEKFPGKLKEEFQSIKAEMIALCPKSYFAHCLKTNERKNGQKGIANSVSLEAFEYRSVLYGSELNHRTIMRSLRLNPEKKMVRTQLNKRGLTNLIYKTAVSEDRVQCHPLRDANQELL